MNIGDTGVNKMDPGSRNRPWGVGAPNAVPRKEREFFIDNLLVRIHFIYLPTRWQKFTELARRHRALSSVTRSASPATS